MQSALCRGMYSDICSDIKTCMCSNMCFREKRSKETNIITFDPTRSYDLNAVRVSSTMRVVQKRH